LTTKILTHFKQQVADLKLIPSRGGCFEFNADGELLYSKLKTQQFPDEDTIIKALEAHRTQLQHA
jgi:selT/selW/selH-like putative selenoprotein